MGVLENCMREELNESAPRALGILRPLKLIIDNYPEQEEEELEAMNHPKKPEMGRRMVPFCRELYIEKSDFLAEAPRKFFRLTPGREVRLRFAYLITCTGLEKNEATGELEVHCTYDPASRGGTAPDGRKVKGTIHWVSARHGVRAQVRLYDRLFAVEDPESGVDDFKTHLNLNSLEVLNNCILEPSLGQATAGKHYQFERQGYFYTDPQDHKPGKPVFNRTVSLRDSWSRKK